MRTPAKFDLAVIGGGPGGYSAAIAAAKRGLRVALYEDVRIGGTCLNVGCIPTKYLLSAAQELENIRRMQADGFLRSSGEFSFKAIQRGKNAAVEKIVGGVEVLLGAVGVTRVTGTAVLRPGKKIECDGVTDEAGSILIATGSEPVRLRLPGAELMSDSTAALSLTRVPPRMICVGGGVIGLEFASLFASYGSEVTILEALPGLMPAELPEAAAFLHRELTARGIRILTGAALSEVRKNGDALTALFMKENKSFSADADFILCAVGRRPCLRGIDDAALGIELTERGAIRTDDGMRTTAEGIYAIGDVTGRTMLAHAAYAEADTAVANILGGSEDVDFSALPRCVYTSPAFAAVGMTPAQAEAAGKKVKIGKFSYAASGMANAIREITGAVYAVCDAETTETLGFTVVGHDACELIAAAQIAVEQHYTSADWQRHIAAHPTLSEMLKEAALSAFGRATHKI